jgi:hypothetical protein
MYQSNSEKKITPKIITKNGYIKKSFDHMQVNEESRAARNKVIELIKLKLQRGIEDYQNIKDELVKENEITFEKYDSSGLFYVSRSSLANHISTARKALGIVFVHDKTKILEMFDNGFGREEIVAAGYVDSNVYAVLKRNGRIEGKYKKGAK